MTKNDTRLMTAHLLFIKFFSIPNYHKRQTGRTNDEGRTSSRVEKAFDRVVCGARPTERPMSWCTSQLLSLFLRLHGGVECAANLGRDRAAVDAAFPGRRLGGVLQQSQRKILGLQTFLRRAETPVRDRCRDDPSEVFAVRALLKLPIAVAL